MISEFFDPCFPLNSVIINGCSLKCIPLYFQTQSQHLAYLSLSNRTFRMSKLLYIANMTNLFNKVGEVFLKIRKNIWWTRAKVAMTSLARKNCQDVAPNISGSSSAISIDRFPNFLHYPLKLIPHWKIKKKTSEIGNKFLKK